jgi:sirohydrochlorin ferrochelatase
VSRALLIVDHGSRQPEAHEHLESIAREVRRRAPGLLVHVAHLELAEPSLGRGIDACVADGAREIAVHPLFLLPGRHLTRDVPAELERAAAAHPGVEIRLTEALGTSTALAEAILATLR